MSIYFYKNIIQLNLNKIGVIYLFIVKTKQKMKEVKMKYKMG